MIPSSAPIQRRIFAFVRISREVIYYEGIIFYLLEIWSLITVRNPITRLFMMRSKLVTSASFVLFRRTSMWFYKLVSLSGTAEITDADPYTIIRVDPDRIETQLEYGEDGPRFTKRHGRVLGGDWDKQTMPFTQKDRFIRWARFDRSPHFDPEEPITKLYFEMKESGYKSQRDIIDEDLQRAIKTSDGALHPRLNEIGVNIDREGNMIWRCYGQHRLILAKILDIDTIPVQVLVRHERWQRVRDKVRTDNETPDRFRNHPDLQDLGEC